MDFKWNGAGLLYLSVYKSSYLLTNYHISVQKCGEHVSVSVVHFDILKVLVCD